MKKLYVLALCGFSLFQTYAQDFPGFRTGNYTGVNGVFYNPANIADSRYRFDVNLFSLSTLVANDQASFKLGTISDNFKGDSIKNQVFGKDAGPTSGMMNVDVQGPSVMFNLGKKNSFAITTRARVFANVTNLDGKLFDKISEDFNNDPSLPYTISSDEKMRISINGWTEFGLSYGRVLSQKGPHFFKAGVTLKYLAGAGNAYMNIDNFNGTIEDDIVLQDVYLQNTTGRVATGFGGISFSDFDASDLLDMESSGFGADLGVVYEFRPDGKNYKLKFGAALLDLGSITYEKDMQRSGAYDINITGSERFSLQQLDGVEFDDLNGFFASYPQYFTASASNSEKEYKVSLPSTLQVNADYHVLSGLYVNLASQVSLSSNESKPFNNKTYGSMTLTPRYEMKRLGFYLPMNYNKLSKLNVGASMRLGPFFVGSGSLLSSLISNSKQADVHFGFRFGMLKK
jgi:hypothetical protein